MIVFYILIINLIYTIWMKTKTGLISLNIIFTGCPKKTSFNWIFSAIPTKISIKWNFYFGRPVSLSSIKYVNIVVYVKWT